MDVAVVGSGPNGLAAAVILARAGLGVQVFEAADHIGGGMRTAEPVFPGHRHDLCSAVHPMALASPFFRRFDLAAHGVRMLQPEAAYAQPLDGGRAGVAWRDLDRTAQDLGPDRAAWLRLFRPMVQRWEQATALGLSDMRSVPRDPLTAAHMGMRVLAGIRLLRTESARGMLAGVGAHALTPRGIPASGAGLLLATLAHAVGWPVPEGGSQAIADALAADLTAHGGKIHTGRRVEHLSEVAGARAVLFDTGAAELARVAGTAMPDRYRRALRRFRAGAGACKVDYVLDGPVPWAAAGCRVAGTVHLAGNAAEVEAAERAVAAGRHAERPYVLAVQAGVVDPGRAPAGRRTLSVYAHVPNGSTVDVSDAVTAQIERFAPGFRDRILGQVVETAAELERRNPNYAGGDILGGAMSVRQMVARPALRWDPYRTPIEGVYICSASTPPGPGVHGMAGLHAAGRVLRQRFGIRAEPLDLLGPA